MNAFTIAVAENFILKNEFKNNVTTKQLQIITERQKEKMNNLEKAPLSH